MNNQDSVFSLLYEPYGFSLVPFHTLSGNILELSDRCNVRPDKRQTTVTGDTEHRTTARDIIDNNSDNFIFNFIFNNNIQDTV